MIMQEESIVSSSRNVFFPPTILESCQDVVNAKRTFFPLFLLFPFLRSCLFPPGGGGEGLLEIIDHCYAKATT